MYRSGAAGLRPWIEKAAVLGEKDGRKERGLAGGSKTTLQTILWYQKVSKTRFAAVVSDLKLWRCAPPQR